MTIMNMNKQAALYTDDYRVWWRAHPSALAFKRTANRVSYKKGEQSTLRFSHKFESAEVTYFAFCVPWSYADNSAWLRRIDEHLSQSAALIDTVARHDSGDSDRSRVQRSSDRDHHAAALAPNERVHVPTSARRTRAASPDREIYYRRQTLARTLQGRRLDVLTITDSFGWQDGAEEAPLPGALHQLSAPVHAGGPGRCGTVTALTCNALPRGQIALDSPPRQQHVSSRLVHSLARA